MAMTKEGREQKSWFKIMRSGKINQGVIMGNKNCSQFYRKQNQCNFEIRKSHGCKQKSYLSMGTGDLKKQSGFPKLMEIRLLPMVFWIAFHIYDVFFCCSLATLAEIHSRQLKAGQPVYVDRTLDLKIIETFASGVCQWKMFGYSESGLK